MTAKIIQFPGSGIGKQILELKNIQTRLTQDYMRAVGPERDAIQTQLRTVANELFHLAMELVDTKKPVKIPRVELTRHYSKETTIILNDKFKYMVRPETDPKE